MNGIVENVDILNINPFIRLKGGANEVEQKAVCQSFINYLWLKTR